MTFSNLQPFTHGYGGVVNQSGAVLGQIPKLVEATERRFAGEALTQAAERKMYENQLNMMKLWAQPQQGQGQQGQGGMDWLGLAQTGLSLAGGLGAFGGGGGGTGTDVFGGWTDFGTGSGAAYVSDIGRAMFSEWHFI